MVDSFNFTRRPGHVLASKLKAVKTKLKEWRKCDTENLSNQRKKLLEQMAIIDANREDRILTEEEITKKVGIMLEYEELVKREESLWRQKSRALWLKEGGKNTKFFHRIANAHRRYNSIDQLMVQGEITQEPHKIKGEIIDFYKKLYTETAQWRPTLQDAQCPVIIEEEKEALQANIHSQMLYVSSSSSS